MLYQRGADLTGLILAVVEFGRGHSESKSKSDRGAAVWGEKRKNAREKGAIMTRSTPAWIEVRGKKLVLIPERAAVLRKIYNLSLAGNGVALIVKHLVANKVPPWGYGKRWSKHYVHKLLTNRAVIGEYQPISHGKPDGEPIPNYYPKAIDEGTFDRVQLSLARRKEKGGNTGRRVATLFGGLIKQAGTGNPIRVTMQTQGSLKGRRKIRSLVTAGALEGTEKSVSFQYGIFETAILSLLREIKPADLFGDEPEGESKLIGDKLEARKAKLALLERELEGDDGDVPALARVIKKLTGECSDLKKQLTEARARESHPRRESWHEAMTLCSAIEDEQRRLRLGELIREHVQEIRVLIVPRRSHRLCACQVYFADGARRDYLIWHQGAANGRKGGWLARSLPNDVGSKGLDLRRKGDVEKLTQTLSTSDIDSLIESLGASQTQERR
jgi:hypothetical protein